MAGHGHPAGPARRRSSPACRAERTALTEVGFAVNDARYDGPECLAPPAPAAQAALF